MKGSNVKGSLTGKFSINGAYPDREVYFLWGGGGVGVGEQETKTRFQVFWAES